MQTHQVHDVDTGAFEAEVLRAAGPVLVEFSADWCPPCRMMEPVLVELAAALGGQLAVRRLDVDRDSEIGIRCSVLSMPTLILFAAGRPVDRLVGFSNAGRVRRWVTDTLETATTAPS